MSDPDVIVVGAGPAGSSTAFRLARAGVRVTMLERARFPRDKPCAECLSPQAGRILRDMGALDAVLATASRLRGMMVRSPEGVCARGDYEATQGHAPFQPFGLGVRRAVFDAVLLGRAADAGALVRHDWRVGDLVRDARGVVCGVRALDRNGRAREFRAPLVVGADGLRSVVARRLGVARMRRWPSRIALVAHYRGVRDVSDLVELHVQREGFVGIADVGDGVTTVAAVFPSTRAAELSSDRDAFLAGWLAAQPQLRARVAAAVRLDAARAVGPFASHARRAAAPGALLVGDAADFLDPFTGEGIYAALRGGELAADAAQRLLATGSDRPDALREYDAARRREFAGKWRVEQLVAFGVACAPVVNRAVRRLAREKPMADLLAGVTGDFVPARRVLNPAYLTRLFLAPALAAQSPET